MRRCSLWMNLIDDVTPPLNSWQVQYCPGLRPIGVSIVFRDAGMPWRSTLSCLPYLLQMMPEVR